MSFVQVEFLWFFAAVWLAYWSIGWRRGQNALLIGASALFYGWIHPWFLILLYGSAGMDYISGRVMEESPRSRNLALAVSLTGNLGLLGVFKYYDFFAKNVNVALSSLGIDVSLGLLEVLLPAGISFYTFQTMSYTIDVWRGTLKARRDLLDYLVYTSFFPQLVAGPIERATEFLPQVEAPRRFLWSDQRAGFGLAIWGAFQKVVVADTVAPYVDKVFQLEKPAPVVLWPAVLGFTVQVLADFSGYTNIARGTARMLGFELTENFRNPYLAVSTPDFWRRWHMSLSRWFRDYLMVPLLGEAPVVPFWRFSAATFVTFLIIGAWHGAKWNYLLVGAWDGAWMVAYGALDRRYPNWHRSFPGATPMAILFHFLVPGLGHALLFREHDVSRLPSHLLTNPLLASRDEWIVGTVVLAVTLAAAAPLVAHAAVIPRVGPAVRGWRYGLSVEVLGWVALGLAIFVFWRSTVRDFVYFAF